MRLPEPSSPVTGPLHSPSSRRDSLAFNRTPEITSGFAQPLVDFTSLLTSTSPPTPPASPLRQREPLSARRNDSSNETPRSQQQDEVDEAQRAESSQESGDDEDDERVVGDTDRLSVQAAVVEIAAVEQDAAKDEGDALSLQSADATGPTVPTPGNPEQPQDESVATQVQAEPVAASSGSQQPDSPEDSTDPTVPEAVNSIVAQAAPSVVEPAAIEEPTADAATTFNAINRGAETAGPQGDATAATSVQTDDLGAEVVTTDQVAATSLTTDDQSSIAAANASLPSEETTSRSSNRRSRGRGEGVSSGKQRDAQRGAADDGSRGDSTNGSRGSGPAVGSPPRSLDPTLVTPPVGPESTVAAASGIDPAMAQRIAALASSAPAAALVAGSAISGSDASAGTVRDNTAATTNSEPVGLSDDSRPAGERTSPRAEPALSKTDIADRARLVHRISKAFTKMGVDGGQIRMKMHPETLGGVLLEMRVQGRTVEATVTADNEAARGLLQQQLSELRQRLESQGMTVQKLEVALRDDSASSGTLLGDQRGGGFQRHDGGSGDDTPSRRAAALGGAGRRTAGLPTGGVAPSRSERAATSVKWPALPGTLDLQL